LLAASWQVLSPKRVHFLDGRAIEILAMENTTRTSAPSHIGVVMGDEPPVFATAADLRQIQLIGPINVLLAREKRPSVKRFGDLEQLCWQWF
jgi:hypothetical protein